MTEVINEDGSISMVPTEQTGNICPHSAEFYMDPNYEQVIAAQRAEIDARNAQAAAEAAAAAAAQQEQQQPAPPPEQQPPEQQPPEQQPTP